jgi:hypothetical protein
MAQRKVQDGALAESADVSLDGASVGALGGCGAGHGGEAGTRSRGSALTSAARGSGLVTVRRQC